MIHHYNTLLQTANLHIIRRKSKQHACTVEHIPSLRIQVTFLQSNAQFRIRLHAQASSPETRNTPHHFTRTRWSSRIERWGFRILSKYILAKVDTGSQSNILPFNIYNNITTSTKLIPYPYKLLADGNEPIVTYGVATVPMYL